MVGHISGLLVVAVVIINRHLVLVEQVVLEVVVLVTLELQTLLEKMVNQEQAAAEAAVSTMAAMELPLILELAVVVSLL